MYYCLSDHWLNSSSSVSASASSTSAFLKIISINRYQVADTIAVKAPFGAKKGPTVKGKSTESEMEAEGTDMLKSLLPSEFQYRVHEFKILEESEFLRNRDSMPRLR